ncbi:MAG: hypothetical protein H6599_06965 [Flavobacteriales bacterium]|nr:hypothetical protein [Flavobacteriales bacterium]
MLQKFKFLLLLYTACLLHNTFFAGNSDYSNELKSIDSISDNRESVNALIQLYDQIDKKDKSVLLEFDTRIGLKYIYLLKIDSAFIYLNEGLLISNDLGKDSIKAHLLKLKGNAYYYLGQKQEALLEYSKSKEISETNGYKEQLASVLLNMGVIKTDLKENDLAEEYLMASSAIHESLGTTKSSDYLLTNRILGTLYYNNEDYEMALPIFTKLVAQTKLLNKPDIQTSAQTFQALTLDKLNRFEEAYAIFQEVIDLQKVVNNLDTEAAVYSFYANFLEGRNRYEEALAASRKMWEIKKQLFDSELIKATTDADAKYNTTLALQEKAIAELQVAQQKNQLMLSERKQEQKNWIIFFLIVFIFLAIVIAGLLLYFRRVKLNQQMEKERINFLLMGEEKERERIAKDLHDGIVQDLTATKHRIQLELTDTTNSDDQFLNSLYKDIGTAANELRNISYQMMPLTLKEFGLQASIESLFERSIIGQNISYECDFIGFEDRLSETLEVTIYRICQELIQNAVKHSNTNSITALFRNNNELS